MSKNYFSFYETLEPQRWHRERRKALVYTKIICGDYQKKGTEDICGKQAVNSMKLIYQ